MYSLRHFHIWLHIQLLALTFSYVRSATPTLNYNHTLTLPIQLYHQCCSHPPTLNYNHMRLNLQFCTYGIILLWHSHPLTLKNLHWDTRLLVTFMHAWKHQISSPVLTAEPYLFILQQQKENHFLPRKKKKKKNMLLFLKTTTFPQNNLESSLFYTSWRKYPTVVIVSPSRTNLAGMKTKWKHYESKLLVFPNTWPTTQCCSNWQSKSDVCLQSHNITHMYSLFCITTWLSFAIC